jgi:hypothetical protein
MERYRIVVLLLFVCCCCFLHELHISSLWGMLWIQLSVKRGGVMSVRTISFSDRLQCEDFLFVCFVLLKLNFFN